MNLISDLINEKQYSFSPSNEELMKVLSVERKPKPKFYKSKVFKSAITLILLIGVFSSIFLYSAKKNEAEALPFGLNNNYLEVMDMNNRFASVVPMPIEKIQTSQESGDKRVVALVKFLSRYGSEMANVSIARAFVLNAEKNGFGEKWYLLPAIAGIESGFGRLTPISGSKKSYNAWGWGGPGNWVYFNSWEDAIERISRGIAKGYGLDNLTPEKMMARYCPPCSNEGGAWAKHVRGFISEMNGIYKGA